MFLREVNAIRLDRDEETFTINIELVSPKNISTKHRASLSYTRELRDETYCKVEKFLELQEKTFHNSLSVIEVIDLGIVKEELMRLVFHVGIPYEGIIKSVDIDQIDCQGSLYALTFMDEEEYINKIIEEE